MKELKFKKLWAVDIDGIQFISFKYKSDAIKYVKENWSKNNCEIVKRKLITDKY